MMHTLVASEHSAGFITGLCSVVHTQPMIKPAYTFTEHSIDCYCRRKDGKSKLSLAPISLTLMLETYQTLFKPHMQCAPTHCSHISFTLVTCSLGLFCAPVQANKLIAQTVVVIGEGDKEDALMELLASRATADKDGVMEHPKMILFTARKRTCEWWHYGIAPCMCV
jgi:hypothetical protein